MEVVVSLPSNRDKYQSFFELEQRRGTVKAERQSVDIEIDPEVEEPKPKDQRVVIDVDEYDDARITMMIKDIKDVSVKFLVKEIYHNASFVTVQGRDETEEELEG